MTEWSDGIADAVGNRSGARQSWGVRRVGTRNLLIGLTVVVMFSLAGVGGLAGVASADETASNVSELDIDEQGSNATVFEGEETVITATVENVGSSNTSFDVDLEIDGFVIESTGTQPLDPGESETVTFTTFPSTDEPGQESNLTVMTEDDSVSGTVTVEEAPGESALDNLDIAGQGDVSTVERGTDEDVSIDVTNVGDGAQSFGLTLALDGEQLTTTATDTLAPGETETVTFEGALSDLDPGEYALTISTAHDVLGGSLTVESLIDGLLHDFDVAGQGANATIAEGENATISVTVTNAGEDAGPIPVTLAVGSMERTHETASLEPGETKTVFFEEVTGDLDPSLHMVSISTDDDERTGTLEVNPTDAASLSTPNVAGQGHTGTVSEGDQASVTVDVTNAGTEAQSFPVTLTVGNFETTSSTATLAQGETETVTFEAVTGNLAAGEHTVKISTTGDDHSGVVVVEQPGTASFSGLNIDNQGTDAQVHPGATVTVSVNVTNVGDSPQGFNVDVSAGEITESTATETLRHGDSETVSIELLTDSLDDGEHQLMVSSGDVTATGTLHIETDDATLSNFAIGNHGDEATIDEGADVPVIVDVTNAGGTAQSFDLSVSVGSTESTASTETLEPGETETVELTGLTGSLEDGEYPVTVSTAGTSIAGDLIVAAEREATLSNLDVAGEGESATVATGEAVDIAVDVTSATDGARPVSFEVTLQFGSETVTHTTERIRGDTVETVAFEGVPVDLDPGEYSLSVETQGDTLSPTVTVTESLAVSLGGLDVAGDGSDGTSQVGESPSISVDVTNQADRAASFALTVEVGSVTETVATETIEAGATETVTVENFPTNLSVGEHAVSVGSGDETVTGTLVIDSDGPLGGELAELDVAEQGQSATVPVGETVSLSVLATNVGDEPGPVETTVTIGSTSVTESTTELAPDSNELLTVGGIAVPDEPGTYDVVVSTDTDEIVGELTVQADDGDDTDSIDDADGDGAGFGVTGFLVGIILGLFLLVRTSNDSTWR